MTSDDKAKEGEWAHPSCSSNHRQHRLCFHFVCLFVCLFVNKVICKNYSTNFHKIRKNPLDFGGNYVSAVCVNMHRAMMMMMMMPD